MKGKFIRILLALIVAIVGFSAFGCGGIPMPEEEVKYKTSVNTVKGLGGVEDLDFVNVSFDIEFDCYDTDKVSEEKLNDAFNKCTVNGTCGTSARLLNESKNIDEIVSCTCRLGKLVSSGSHYKSNVNCTVPIPGGMKEGNMLTLTTVAPILSEDGSSLTQKLVFSSSPQFEIIGGELISMKFEKYQIENQ